MCLFFSPSLCIYLSVVSATPINSFSILHTHIQARRMHPSWLCASFIRLILPFRAAGQHRISLQLPCSRIDFRSCLNYFGMRPITQVLHLTLFDHVSSYLSPPPPSVSLTPSPHVLLFTWAHFVYVVVCFLFFFLHLLHQTCFSFSCFGTCMDREKERGRENEYT